MVVPRVTDRAREQQRNDVSPRHEGIEQFAPSAESWSQEDLILEAGLDLHLAKLSAESGTGRLSCWLALQGLSRRRQTGYWFRRAK